MDLQSVLQSIEENKIKYVRMEFSDQYGIARGKTIPARHFEQKATKGERFVKLAWTNFDPQPETVIFGGTGYGEEDNYGDALCFPDFDTFIILPWVKDTARVLLDPTYQGKPVKGFARAVAKKQCDRLKELGYSLLAAHEHEFILRKLGTKEPAFDTQQYCSILRSSFNIPFTQQLEQGLASVGVDLDSIETEFTAGQVELPYAPAFGIKAADNAHTFKTAVKEIALQHDYNAMFMTKPDPTAHVASGAHLNHSLWDADGKNNLLYYKNGKYGLSDIAQHWIAGILEHAPALTLLSSPTINCLRRYRPHAWSPINVTWGLDNRTVLLRAKVSEQNTYLENRLPGSAGSPYLSLAGTIIAGIDGIQRQLPLPAPVNGDACNEKNLPSIGVKNIPTNMKDALEAFVKDKTIIDGLGSDFVKAFGAARMHEVKCQEEAKAKGDESWEENFYSFL